MQLPQPTTTVHSVVYENMLLSSVCDTSSKSFLSFFQDYFIIQPPTIFYYYIIITIGETRSLRTYIYIHCDEHVNGALCKQTTTINVPTASIADALVEYILYYTPIRIVYSTLVNTITRTPSACT